MELKGIAFYYESPPQKFMSITYSFVSSQGKDFQEEVRNFWETLQSLQEIIDSVFEKTQGVKREESLTIKEYDVHGTYGYTAGQVLPEKGYRIALSYALRAVTEVKLGTISIQHTDDQERLFRIYDRISEFRGVSHGLLAQISMRRIDQLRDGNEWVDAFEESAFGNLK